MIKRIQVIFLILLFPLSFTLAQNNNIKVYFDKSGNSTSEGQAYTYRQKVNDQLYKEYYVNGGALFFEGKLLKASDTDQSKNIYTGTCTWYYKNGKKKAIRVFDAEGLEDGTSTYYYESGKNWKEIVYVKGKILNNSIVEYDEDGVGSKIVEDDFTDNSNDWDLYTSDKNSARIENGALYLESVTKAGTSRYISIPSQSAAFALEAVINIEKLKSGEKTGLIFGFKDWQNYNFFLISSSAFYVGSVYEGISAIKNNGMFSGEIKPGSNTIKIISNGDKNIYSINGSVQYTTDRTRNFGSNIGFAVSGKSAIAVEKLIYKNMEFRAEGTTQSNTDLNIKGTGSGIIFSTDGYILTNHHVIENENKIIVEITTQGVSKSYNATVVKKDMDNDLAILKIEDKTFSALNPLQYSFKESGATEVGANVFAIGYPFALTGMGKEAKFTDGKISAKTGYNSAVNSYQTSIPVQPGNSGGPLFNDKGELIGIMNAKITGADNVSYAIKLNYIKNLIEILPDTPPLPDNKALLNMPLEGKIKILSDYVVLIKVK